MNRTFLAAGAVLSTSSLLLVDSAIKGGVLLVLAALGALVLRRDSAATRHLVWQVSIVGMLVVPLFSAVLPHWRVLPSWAVLPRTSAVVETEPAAVELPAPAFESPARTPMRMADLPPSPGPIEIKPDPAAPVVAQQPDDLANAQHAVVPAEIVSAATGNNWNIHKALPLLWLIGFSALMLRLIAARMMLWSGERRGTVIAVSQNVAPCDRTNEQSDEAIVNAFAQRARSLPSCGEYDC